MSKSAKNLRDCPAAERKINPKECGESRNSKFACPASCPFNPLAPANYDQFSELEGAIIDKSMAWFARENRENPAAKAAMRKAMEAGDIVLTAHCFWNFYWLRDAGGLTMVDRWEARRFEGLNNDERAVLKAHRQARPAVIELRRVVGEYLVEAVNLLTGERITIADRSLTGKTVRFAVALAWLVPAPHFWRIVGAAQFFPEVSTLEPLTIFQAIATKLGAPDDDEGELRWLAEHWPRFARALSDSTLAIRRATILSVDAKHYTTDYRLRGDVDAFVDLLGEYEDFEGLDPSPEQAKEGFIDAFDVSADQNGHPSPMGRLYGKTTTNLLGTVLVGKKNVRLKARSEAAATALRKRFEDVAGKTVEFTGELIEDIGAQLGKGADYDESLVPQCLIDDAPKVAILTSRINAPAEDATASAKGTMLDHHRAWVDAPIPALDGKTPREAVEIPELRDSVVHMLKRTTRAADARSFEESDLMTQIIQDLGLHEIAEPTPPNRPVAYAEDDSELPDASGLPGALTEPDVIPIPFESLEKRMTRFVKACEPKTKSRWLEEFEENAADLLEYFDSVVCPKLSDDEATFAHLLVAQAYMLVVPEDDDRTDVDFDRLGCRMTAHYSSLEEDSEKSTLEDGAASLIAKTRQPDVAEMLAASFFGLTAPGQGMVIQQNEKVIIFAFLMAAMDELDMTVAEVDPQ